MAYHFLARCMFKVHFFPRRNTRNCLWSYLLQIYNYFYFILLIANTGKWHATSGKRLFKTAPWKKSVSRRPFWCFGGTRYGRNKAVGQNRQRRDSHMLFCIYTGCLELAARCLKHTWCSHTFGFTASVSTALLPKLSIQRAPTQPSESLQGITSLQLSSTLLCRAI